MYIYSAKCFSLERVRFNEGNRGSILNTILAVRVLSREAVNTFVSLIIYKRIRRSKKTLSGHKLIYVLFVNAQIIVWRIFR